MIKINNRIIYDDYIVKVNSWEAAINVVAKFKELGCIFPTSVEKDNCYYVARRVVMDEGFSFDDGCIEKKFVSWGRSEVEESDEFNKMITYAEFMGEKEPYEIINDIIKTVIIN